MDSKTKPTILTREITEALLTTIILSLIYGFLISFSVSIFFKTVFDFNSIIAFGVAWYLIEAKFPFIVNSYRGVKA